MGPSFSFEYYDRIFGGRTEAYRELLDAMAAELRDYASAVVPVLENRDADGLSRLRHSHRPLVENLKLVRLRELEEALRAALDAGAAGPSLTDLDARFREEALAVATALNPGRFPDGPGPRAPSLGG